MVVKLTPLESRRNNENNIHYKPKVIQMWAIAGLSMPRLLCDEHELLKQIRIPQFCIS